jgi:hypothetical protein
VLAAGGDLDQPVAGEPHRDLAPAPDLRGAHVVAGEPDCRRPARRRIDSPSVT